MANTDAKRKIEVLLIEDDSDDVYLMRRALADTEARVNLHVAHDGEEAMAFLRREDAPRPDLVLLDLNMPRKDGLETLAEIKTDSALKYIPVIVLTSSDSPEDVLGAYDAYVNCYMVKPMKHSEFVELIRDFEKFWFTVAMLPPDKPA